MSETSEAVELAVGIVTAALGGDQALFETAGAMTTDYLDEFGAPAVGLVLAAMSRLAVLAIDQVIEESLVPIDRTEALQRLLPQLRAQFGLGEGDL